MSDVVPASQRRSRYLATAGQTVFDIGFPITAADDVAVYINNVETALFSADVKNLIIELLEGSEDGDIVVIEGDLEIKRQNNYPRGGNLDTVRLNFEFNTIIRSLQEMRRDMARAIGLSKSEAPGVSGVLATAQAGRTIAWNADATGLENGPTINDIMAVLPNAEAAAASAAAAQESYLQTSLLLDNFDDRYLGTKTADPIVDNDGDPLMDGSLYYNSVEKVMKVYDLGNAEWGILTLDGFNVRVTEADTVPGFLGTKITTGVGLQKSVTAAGGDEKLQFVVNFNEVATKGQGEKADTALQPSSSRRFMVQEINVSAGTAQVVLNNLQPGVDYEIEGNGIYGSANSNIRFRTSSNNGSSWVSGATDYLYQNNGASNVTAQITAANSTSGYLAIGYGTTDAYTVNFHTEILSPMDGNKLTRSVSSWAGSNGSLTNAGISGSFRTAKDSTNAIQLFPESGTFSGGTIRLWANLP